MSYEMLVQERKQCRKCGDELVNPAQLLNAKFDGSEVGPWSRWLASRPAKLILVGQDWGTVGYFEKYCGRDIIENKSNKNLKHLLSILGFEVGPPNRTDDR